MTTWQPAILTLVRRRSTLRPGKRHKFRVYGFVVVRKHYTRWRLPAQKRFVLPPRWRMTKAID